MCTLKPSTQQILKEARRIEQRRGTPNRLRIADILKRHRVRRYES